jgi:hypothetical protein
MTIREKLIGTWRIISQHTQFPDGTIQETRGKNPTGLLIYDTQGNMSVQLMRTDEDSGKQYDLRKAETFIQEYHAYFGTYAIHEAKSEVHHHIIGAAFPDYRGTTQIRPFTLEGDTLTLRVFAADDTIRVLVWQKLEGQIT